MPRFNVQKSIDVAATLERVQGVLVDFQQWPAWSPWLCAERDCKVSVQGSSGQPDHRQTWEGDIIGSGQMQLVSNTPERIDMDLNFIKPFKSQADVSFKLQALDNNNTRVEWMMNSSLPFFLFFMTSSFTAMIGADYRRGLLQLKDYIETGTALTRSDVVGIVDVAEFSYMGIKGSASIEQIGDVLGSKFGLLEEAYTGDTNATGDGSGNTPGVYTFYNKMDVKRQHCDFTAAMTPSQSFTDSSDFSLGKQGASKALKIVHTGEYRHLGNAWATGMMYARAKKLKLLKNLPPFEKYINDPNSTPGPELITEIYLPVK